MASVSQPLVYTPLTVCLLPYGLPPGSLSVNGMSIHCFPPHTPTTLIQNLMLAAIHGSSQGLVANIRRVLAALHGAKKLGGAGSVDGMLVRLYEPILFRAMAAANAGVRRNSLQLLLDAFPLLVREGVA